jgi:hypothetical protein
MELGCFFSQQILEKYSNNKFYDLLSIGSRVVHSGWTDRQTDRRADRQTERRADRQADRQTDVKKLIVAFPNFANVPKNKRSLVVCHNNNITVLLIVLINYRILA